MLKQQLGKSSCTDWRTYYCAYTNALGYSSARSVHYLCTYYVAHGKIDDMMGVTTTTIHKSRGVGRSKIRGGALCVEMGFTWTFPRNQDATVKLKSELISIKF